MPSALADRRREIFAAARSRPGDFLRFDAGRLRFWLGANAGDPRVPTHVAPDAAQLVRGAAADLALLLSTSHRAFVPADEFDRLVLSEGYAALPMAAPSLGPSGGGADLRAAAQTGAESHPALTGPRARSAKPRAGHAASWRKPATWFGFTNVIFGSRSGERPMSAAP